MNIVKPISETAAKYNMRTKIFGDDMTKIVCFSRQIFNPHGLEVADKFKKKRFKKSETPEISEELQALAESIPEEFKATTLTRDRKDSERRAQGKVFEIAYANDFTHFITLTLDGSKISRDTPSEIKDKLGNWLKNNVQRRDLSYLLVAEYHKDKAIHFHGLIKGNLDMTDSGKVKVAGRKKPISKSYAKHLGLEGQTVYNIDGWQYGFSTALELVGERIAVSSYVAKYITKDTEKIFGRFYFSGGNLSRQVPTVYDNFNFYDFEGVSHEVVENYLSVKYKTTRKD